MGFGPNQEIRITWMPFGTINRYFNPLSEHFSAGRLSNSKLKKGN